MRRVAVSVVLCMVGVLAMFASGGPATAAKTGTTTTTSGPPAGLDPILFVHGWHGDLSSWTTMIGRFQADGWPIDRLFNWTYDSDQSNAITAKSLASKVKAILGQTGASRVDIISHSMGSLSSRYYIKSLAGGVRVDDWVSLAGPNHGTDIFDSCPTPACVEMRAGSSFLNALNAGDETPGALSYGTWWSPCDAAINPDTSVALAGATNTETACISHTDLVQDAAVYAQVRDFVR